jgi:hypothetical protein
MPRRSYVAFALVLIAVMAAPQARAQGTADTTVRLDTLRNPEIKAMAARLDLEKYKATIKGLTQFGDRRQGTARNRAAVDWIEAQLKSFGCTNTERVVYTYTTPPRRDTTGRGGRGGATGDTTGRGGRGGGRGDWISGARYRGMRTRMGVNTDSLKQTDPKLRALNAEPATDGERQEVFCTKIGATHPDEMYIIGGHMDGIGWGEAANDDGSGTAVVMELARIFSSPDIQTDRSIRFALWNNEETGTNGARAYIVQRQTLQGKENPPGSGKYPEPKWLGMIQHDMMLFDHGMPRPDGTMSPDQRSEADVNIEFAMTSKFSEGAQKLAWAFATANDKYATDYPAQVGQHMTNTDSAPFQNLIPAISLRENERGRDIGAGWDPQWHQVTDLYATYNDKDFRLGLNAAQTTLSAVATLTGAKLRK